MQYEKDIYPLSINQTIWNECSVQQVNMFKKQTWFDFDQVKILWGNKCIGFGVHMPMWPNTTVIQTT